MFIHQTKFINNYRRKQCFQENFHSYVTEQYMLLISVKARNILFIKMSKNMEKVIRQLEI